MTAYILHVCIIMVLFSMLSLSLNIAVGMTGLVSLGHAAFFGIGAYASGLMMLCGLPFEVSLVLSGIVTSVFGIILAVPSLRVKDDYLAIVTLGFGIIAVIILMNMDITGGPDGLTGIPPASVFGVALTSKPVYFAFCSSILAIMVLTTSRLKASKVGRAWAAIRDHDTVAMFMGINIYYYKVLCIVISSFWAGIAGSLYAHYTGYINPVTFGMQTSIMILAMVVLGGIGSIPGSIIGASVLVLLPELLRGFEAHQGIFYGALLVTMMVLRPQGIMGRMKVTDIFARGS
ncbi:MAG: branched-chain amino acid ABC transporter permease [Deltaproteobacteria bacterium]|nr:branched-chain amino acid ABC transporter permease [Deltaproteobacteria bacterium]